MMSHKKNKRKKHKLSSGNKGLTRRNIPIKEFRFDIGNELKKALQYHQSGQLQEAEEIYKKILKINPNHSDSLHLSGVIAHQVGKNDIAVDLINKAIKTNPKSAIYYNNLGNAYKDQGKLNEAISSYQKALQLRPDHAEAYNNLGAAYKDQGKLNEAISSYQKALQLRPDLAESYNNLGAAFNDQGKLNEAISSYQKALQLKPDYAEAYNSMGVTFKNQGKLGEALSSYQKALQLKPDYAEAYNNLGNVFKDQGKLNEAILCYQKALQLKPDLAESYNNLGAAFNDQGKLGEALSSYQKALQLKPDYAEAYNSMGAAFKDQGKLGEALSSYQKALQLKPDYAEAHSNLLFSLHCRSSDPVQLFIEHQQWAVQHASPLATTIQPHLNDRLPGRRLRVGYVSPDFRTHSVAYFIEPVLASHDSYAFEVFCYSDVACPDPVTNRLKGLASCWRDIFGMSDEQVADLVRNDQIDLLVDLAGHTAYNRMLLFGRKPAPVQVTYLGYPNTTGLPTMDYRITDSWADPPGETDHLYTEKLVRLPQSFLCYKPPEETPVVAKLPARDSGSITFGSFNNRTKIGPEVVMLWSKILSSTTNSQLILKSKSFYDIGAQKLLREMFVQNGVSPGRIKFVGRIPSLFKHLELYNSIDIGLDTFPYNGTTTTCEAMWMGVPVIVLAGRTHISRVGVSLLSNIGLTDLIAETAETYLEKAVKLAGDLKRLRKLQTNLRDMISYSPLTDAHRFTRALEEAYRKIWRHWCHQSMKASIISEPSEVREHLGR